MIAGVRRAAWMLGWPVRALLLALIGAYRLTLGRAMGGRCRFYPSCSAYAEAAIRQVGAVRGSALAAWRILRCSPLTAGGVDHPPGGAAAAWEYDAIIPRGASGSPRPSGGTR